MHDLYDKNTFSEKFIVDRAKVSTETTMKWDHYHDFYEIYYYLGNAMNYFIDNKTYNVNKHDIVLIDTYMLHRTLYTPQNHGERILILFHPDILELLGDNGLIEKVKTLFHKKRLSFSAGNTQIIGSIMSRISDYYARSHPHKEIKSRFAMLELLLTILELYEDDIPEDPTYQMSPKEKKVSEIVTYINSNYQSDITLDTLCSELFINKYYICHIFKEITGMSVIDFINTKRLAEAERLLRYSSLSITDICQTVGFNSISHFINLFKQSYQCTPRSFRNSIDKKSKA